MRRALARRLSLVAATGVALAAVLATGLAAPAQAGTDPDVGRPEVGSCHDLTLEEASAEAEPQDAVRCRSRHTTLTIAVPDAPRNPDWDSTRLYDWSITACQRELVDFYGGRVEKLALSSYEIFFFYPTRAQRENGAEWVRCDVGLLGGVRLDHLDGGRRPSLSLTRDVAYCLAQGRLDYVQTTCAHAHAYRAEATVRSGQRTYPSERAWKRLARRCPRRAPYYLQPGRQVYKGGMVHLVCFAKTKR